VATHSVSPTQSGNSSSKKNNTEKCVVLTQVLTGTHALTQSGNSSSKKSNTEKCVVLTQVLTGTHALTQSGHSSTEAPYECRLPHLLQTRLLQPEQAVSVLPPKNPLLNGWKHTPHLPPPMAKKVLAVVSAVAACPAFCRSRVCLCAVSPRLGHCH
jgi:hypothetical protein